MKLNKICQEKKRQNFFNIRTINSKNKYIYDWTYK